MHISGVSKELFYFYDQETQIKSNQKRFGEAGDGVVGYLVHYCIALKLSGEDQDLTVHNFSLL